MCEFVVDTNEILNNLKKIKNKISKETKICAVVKADAYGFGVKKVYEILSDKVDYFAVARLSEFLELKAYGLIKPCLILNPLYNEELEIAISQGAEIIITNYADVTEINEIAKKYQTKAKVHLKVDTGMNRFGFNNFNHFKKAVKNIKNSQNIELEGLCSHFYNAENKEDALKQRSRFLLYKKFLRKYNENFICHLSASTGIKDKNNQFDMVRVGFDLYHSNKHKLTCKVLQVKNVKKGETIGYGGAYIASKNMTIAICSMGYADGFLRRLNKSYVLINGIKCKIVGNICMDSFMAVAKEKLVNINDEVVIFGKSKEKLISVCDLARLCDTISYEIYTNISKRVKRVYL